MVQSATSLLAISIAGSGSRCHRALPVVDSTPAAAHAEWVSIARPFSGFGSMRRFALHADVLSQRIEETEICVANGCKLMREFVRCRLEHAHLVANLVANPGIDGDCRGLQRKWISNLLILLTLPPVRVPSAPPVESRICRVFLQLSCFHVLVAVWRLERFPPERLMETFDIREAGEQLGMLVERASRIERGEP